MSGRLCCRYTKLAFKAPAVRKKYPAIPFKEMAGMRDVLSHEYFGINHKVVWNVVETKLHLLIGDLREMIRDVEGGITTVVDIRIS